MFRPPAVLPPQQGKQCEGRWLPQIGEQLHTVGQFCGLIKQSQGEVSLWWPALLSAMTTVPYLSLVLLLHSAAVFAL